MLYRGNNRSAGTEAKAKYVGKFQCHDEDRKDMISLLHRHLPGSSKHLQKVKVRVSEKGLSCSDRSLFREAIYSIGIPQIVDCFVDPVNDGIVYFVCPKNSSLGSQYDIHSFLCKSNRDAVDLCSAYWKRSHLQGPLESNLRQYQPDWNHYDVTQQPGMTQSRHYYSRQSDNMSVRSEPFQRYNSGHSHQFHRDGSLMKMRDGGGDSSSDESGIGYSSGSNQVDGYHRIRRVSSRKPSPERIGYIDGNYGSADYYDGGHSLHRVHSRGDGSAKLKVNPPEYQGENCSKLETQSMPPHELNDGGGTLVRKMRKVTTKTERKPKDGGPPVVEIQSHVEPVEEYRIPGHLSPDSLLSSQQPSFHRGKPDTIVRSTSSVDGRNHLTVTPQPIITKRTIHHQPQTGSLRRGMSRVDGHSQQQWYDDVDSQRADDWHRVSTHNHRYGPRAHSFSQSQPMRRAHSFTVLN